MIKKVGLPFHVELNSHQKFFGATGFKTKVVNLHEDSMETLSTDAVEIVENIEDAHTATVDVATPVGSRTIVLADGANLEDGEVFETPAGDKYYIDSVVDGIVKLKFALTQALASGDDLTQVGNTGVYKISIAINTAGDFGVYVSNPSLNMRLKGIQYTLKDIVIEDIAQKLDSLETALADKINSIQSTLDNAESAEFTVFGG